jgi:hypothetical protein
LYLAAPRETAAEAPVLGNLPVLLFSIERALLDRLSQADE